MKQYKDIASRNNPIYKLVKALSQKKFRESEGLFLLEGAKLLEEAGKRGVKIKYLIQSETAEYIPLIASDCQTLRLPDILFKKISNTVSPQGIIAVAEQIKISELGVL